MSRGFALAVHGGAGTPPDRARRDAVQEALRESLARGEQVLAQGGDALDAVVSAVRVLEAAPDFNAGTGSVLSADGEVEMDAAVMEGAGRRAGAVACVRRVVHPVDAARAVLEDGRHVLLCGEGADAFALAAGVAAAAPGSLVTERRRDQLTRALARREQESGGGTVGAVALDRRGVLAAATSTGGLVAKRPGRISDSASIGCGTWADERCAVSATGRGEYFIRSAFAHAVAAELRAGAGLAAACADALAEVERLGGSGGCIAVDADGNLALPFGTRAMPRAWLRAGEPAHIAIGAEPWEADPRVRLGSSS